MRLAWFSPWPPLAGDAAGRSATLVPALAARGHAIDVFVDERRTPVTRLDSTDPPAPGTSRVAGAHDFVWRHARAPYDLGIYHLADHADHDYVWPYLFHWPGVAVLHDGRVHQSRSRSLLLQNRHDDYRAEFAWNHPDVAPAAAELAVNGYEGAFCAQWPMIRTVLASSRGVITHARGALAELELLTDRPIEYVAPADGASIDAPVSPEIRARIRGRLGLPPEGVVFTVDGQLSADARVPQILRAFAAAHARVPGARLLLHGRRDPSVDVDALVSSLGLVDVVRVVDPAVGTDAPSLTADEIAVATDVTIALRWPAAWDTPAPWLRALASGQASVILDLIHLGRVPALDPRTWRRHAPSDGSPRAEAEAVTVAIDIMDEEHSLRLALQRLAGDAGLRADLGRAGRAYWQAEHARDTMVAGFERALVTALARPAPDVALPPHLRPDPLATALKLAGEIDPEVRSRVNELSGVENDSRSC